MQRDGGELADILNGRIPSQAVVHFRDDAKIDAVRAGLFEHAVDHAALVGGGEKDLVDKVLAGVLEHGVQVADHVTGLSDKARSRTRELDESLE